MRRSHNMLLLGLQRGIVVRLLTGALRLFARRPKSRNLVGWILGVALSCYGALSCESTRDDRISTSGAGSSDASAGAGGIANDASTSGWGGQIPAPDASFYDGPAYDGDTSCAPDAGLHGTSSCCEGVPCNGDCELHDGQWQCYCYGIEGGCTQADLVCCQAGAGCRGYYSCNP